MVLQHNFKEWCAAALEITTIRSFKHGPFYGMLRETLNVHVYANYQWPLFIILGGILPRSIEQGF